ncbi:MAG TPA: flippase-like domain-containing protein [Gemmatimonadaceae bacterium]|nr:flippase-like domain-containing protein [Gemmatimonadaceae bacterium]
MKRTSAARTRSRTTIPLLVILALAVHTILPQIATLEESAAVLQRLRWWAVVVAVIAQAASYWGYGYTLHALARLTRDRLSVWGGAQIALAASSVGVLVGGPVGFAAATYRWTRARGVSYEGAILCGWLPKVLNALVLIGLTIAGAAELVMRHRLSQPQLVALTTVSVAMTALVVGAIWVSWSERRLAPLVGGARRRWARLRHRPADETSIAQAVARFATARRLLWPKGWHQPLLGGVANAGFDIVTLYGLFLAARYDVGVGTLLAGYGLPQLLARVAFLPGGVGVVEGGMVALYRALGVPATTAVLAVLVYRALSFWLPMLLGFLMATVLQRRSAAGHDGADTGGSVPREQGA